MKTNNKQENKINLNTVSKACELGGTLFRIHNRLIMEGYKISDKKIIPPEHKKNYNVNIE